MTASATPRHDLRTDLRELGHLPALERLQILPLGLRDDVRFGTEDPACAHHQLVERTVQMNVNRNIALQPILQLQEERIPAVTQVDRHLRVKGVAIRQNDPSAAIYAFTFA